jgi:hypothetical protein
VLHNRAPEKNFAANAAIPELDAWQGLEALACVHAAAAIGFGNDVGNMCWETDKLSVPHEPVAGKAINDLIRHIVILPKLTLAEITLSSDKAILQASLASE